MGSGGKWGVGEREGKEEYEERWGEWNMQVTVLWKEWTHFTIATFSPLDQPAYSIFSLSNSLSEKEETIKDTADLKFVPLLMPYYPCKDDSSQETLEKFKYCRCRSFKRPFSNPYPVTRVGAQAASNFAWHWRERFTRFTLLSQGCKGLDCHFV
jgi:hypothetical protein